MINILNIHRWTIINSSPRHRRERKRQTERRKVNVRDKDIFWSFRRTVRWTEKKANFIIDSLLIL